MTRAAKLPFAGAYYFEFYIEGEKEFAKELVRVVYRDEFGKLSYPQLACSRSKDTACPKEDWKVFL